MSDIECKIKYEKRVFIEVVIGKNALDIDDASPFERIDYHEDGSQSKYYGFEISKSAYENFIWLLRNRGEL